MTWFVVCLDGTEISFRFEPLRTPEGKWVSSITSDAPQELAAGTIERLTGRVLRCVDEPVYSPRVLSREMAQMILESGWYMEEHDRHGFVLTPRQVLLTQLAFHNAILPARVLNEVLCMVLGRPYSSADISDLASLKKVVESRPDGNVSYRAVRAQNT